MKPLADFIARMAKYKAVRWLYETGTGAIAWHLGTGENHEILFLEVESAGNGQGRRMLELYVREAAMEPPYESVYVFHLESNEKAAGFYEHMGFKKAGEAPIYRGQAAVLRVIKWNDLVERLGIVPDA